MNLEKLTRLASIRDNFESDSDMFLRRLGFVEKKRFGRDKVINNPEDKRFKNHTDRIFPAGTFVYGEPYNAINSSGDFMADALVGQPTEVTEVLLVDFGVKVTSILEESSPLAMLRDPNDIAGRIGHSLVRAQSTILVRSHEPMTSRVQRDRIIFNYSDALTRATQIPVAPIGDSRLVQFPKQNSLPLAAD